MDPQMLPALTGLDHKATLTDRVHFTTSAGTLEVGFWDEDIVRIRLGDGAVNTYPIIVGTPAGKGVDYLCQDGVHVVRCGQGEVHLTAAGPNEPCSLTYRYQGRTVVQPSPDGHFVRRFRIPPFARTDQGWFFSIALQPGAPIYGFGEKYGSLDKRGQHLVSWAEDALGVNAERCYKNAPFCWTPCGSQDHQGTAGYGVFVHTAARVTHGAGYPQWSNWSYAALVEDDILDLFFIAGDTGEQILKRYTDITGRAGEVPLWSLGNWISRAYYTTFDEAEEMARTIRQRKIPCDVFTLDGRAWQDTDTRFYFEWDASRYPEPGRFISIMRELELKLCVWEYPICSMEHPLYQEFSDKGWFLKDEEGNTYEYEFDLSPFGEVLTPLPPSGLLDFTVPEAAQWWYEQHRKLHEAGVDVFKVDFGEQTPEDAYASNGDSGIKCHNAIPLLYNATCFEAAKDHFGQGLVWARSGWAGSQRYSLQWGGDPQASWNGLAGSILGGQSWGMTGVPFYAHDIGGFYGGPPDSELYVRWLQAGVLGSFCRIHGIGPREPWYFGDEAEAIVRDWLGLRYQLIPYLERQVREASLSGLPVLRAMPVAFPGDRAAWAFELQYMLGDHLLVAPVLQPGGHVQVYLPAGVWYDFFTNERYTGSQVLTLCMPLHRIPVFVRAGAVLALGPAVQHTGELAAKGRLERIKCFGLPTPGALDHEESLQLTVTADSAVIRGVAVPCEAVDVEMVLGKETVELRQR